MIRLSMTRPGAGLAIAIATVGVLATTACDTKDLLEQTAPSTFADQNLNDPTSATLLVNSAIGDFECALAQYVVATGLVSDELLDAQLGVAGWDYDRRTIVPSLTPYATNTCNSTQVVGLYTPISIARFTGDDATRRLEKWTDAQVPNRQELIATAATHAGFALLLLGESSCSAAIDGGPELTPAQLFTEAETRFTKAIGVSAAGSAIRALALAGRARATLDLTNYPGAKAVAQAVPADFVRNATYSQSRTRRENRVYAQMWRDNFASVEAPFRNLTFGGVPDPRVTVVNSGVVGQDATTIVWRATKYPTIGSPIPIASSREMQLIVAEADLNGAGTQAEAVAIINALHAKAALPAYDPAAAGAKSVKDQLIEERSREMFLEGHRLWDMIRFSLPLTPPAGAAYPPKAGGTYGSQLCFPLPDVERNNNPTLRGS
jgi:hypothetical protein